MPRVRKTLKKYFIPHEENGHRPHLLRPRTVLFVCLVALAVEGTFLVSESYIIPHSKLFGIIVSEALVDGTNKARTDAALPPLQESALLDVAAQEKANDMAANNYFAHTSPSGLSPWYWFEQAGYSFQEAGENLAVNFSDSRDVTSAWLNSPEHRANILNAGFTEIGMATAQGNFRGKPAIYVVELFGAPSPAPAGSFAAAAPIPAPHRTAGHGKGSVPSSIGTEMQNFAAVKGATAVASSSSTASTTAPIVARISDKAGDLVQGAFSDPRRTVDTFYFFVAVLFTVALLLNIFIKIRIQYKDLIFGGMLVIIITILFVALNQHFGAGSVVVL